MSTRVTTKTDLLLLGLLLERPMHGYELYQQLQAEGIDDWFNISAASVYYSLHKLRDQRLVAESRQRRGSSSRKSIYHLTEKGRSTFFSTMETELASLAKTCLDYDLVIYLLNRLPLHRAMPQLQKRQAFLTEQVEAVQVALTAERNGSNSPLKRAILDHKRRFLEMEQDWLADVIRNIQKESKVCVVKEGTQRGLMLLDGDLSDFHLPDLFRLIVSGQHTGTLTVSDGAEVRTLSFQAGQPVYASYVRRGKEPAALASYDEVLKGLCELFRWEEGRFIFDQRMEYQDWCIPVECSAEELILRGCRKVDNWTIIQHLVPSADTIFEPGSAYQHLNRLTLAPDEERVVAVVDGVKDVATIARELDLTLFDTSRAVYCLAAIGVLRTADLDRILLRRAFREIAELMCKGTTAWGPGPDDRTCEDQVNAQCAHLPLHLSNGRLGDQADPQLGINELKEMYQTFLREQYKVVSRCFGRANARQSFKQMFRQLSPDLQETARRYGFDRPEVD